jgi:hypothetical protein
MSGGQNVFRNELTQESWVEISYVIFFGKKSGIRGSVTLNPKAGEKIASRLPGREVASWRQRSHSQS